MSLVPNKKNKKDNRPGGGANSKGSSKTGFTQNTNVKASTKAMGKNVKATGGAQRGS